MKKVPLNFLRRGLWVLLLVCVSATPVFSQDTIVRRSNVQLPNPESILLWLDAADLVPDDSHDGLTWIDKLSETPFSIEGKLVENEMNGLPVVRMEGGQGIIFEPKLDNGPATTFVVFKRDSEQAHGGNRQRILSVWDGVQKRDLKKPNYALYISRGDEVVKPTIYRKSSRNGTRHTFGFGSNASNPEIEHLYGDLAEIIMYKQTFDSFEPVEEILAYLGTKWGVEYNDVEWVREGHLTPVTRISHTYPLSDQQNTKNWVRYDPWCDEFDDGILDLEKWLPYNHVWYGRAPARFLPENVAEGDGMVTLAIKKHPDLPVERFHGKPEEYKDYSSATLSSLKAKRYGYVEARAKAEVGSSAFWLYAESHKDGLYNQLEIDVYELGGVQKGYETLYSMNAHKFAVDGVKHHTEMKGVWYSDIRFVDDFHVFGLEWTEKTLKYYVDGVLVRRAPNVYWHGPLLLLFDTETMPNWFGVPADKDLPGLHKIDYVRAWFNDDTVDTWQEEYTLVHDPEISRPVETYLKQFPWHVNEGQ